MKHNKLVVLILFVILLFRLFLLGKFPVGITHDELNYIISAKSIYLTGSFAPGTASSILPTSMSNFSVTVAEVPSYILALLIGPFSMSLFMSRIVGVIFSLLICLVIYLLTLKITKNKKIAIIAFILSAINPWAFLMGRTVFEVNFYLTFLLWGLYLLLKAKGEKILYALPLYILGFFSYIGGQIVFYLFSLISIGYVYFRHRAKTTLNVKWYLIFIFTMTFSLVLYLSVTLNNQSIKARGSELYLPSDNSVSQQVNSRRQLAIISNLSVIFVNKATVYVRGFFDKYFKAFSTDVLFINGETRAAFSFQEHGTFYIIDFFFIIFGLAALYKRDKKSFYLILGVILISPITSGLSDVEYSYSQRAGLMFPFLIILCAVGIYEFINLFKTKNLIKIITTGVIFIYVLFFANLVFVYFFRFPVYASDGWFLQDRVLSRYVSLTSTAYPDQVVVVYSNEPKIIFEEYLFYSNLYNKRTAYHINETMNKGRYTIDNVVFTDTCIDNESTDQTSIYKQGFECKNIGQHETYRITRLKDVLVEYQIENDVICKNYQIPQYVSGLSRKSFDIELLNVNNFCQTWITRL